MAVGFKARYNWFQVGSGDFLYSFFSTICYHLESRKWGSKYPYIMRDLYRGKLKVEHIEKAMDELVKIRKGLQKLPPNRVIWNLEDLSQKPPWGDNISKDIKNLADYFVTSGGYNLLDVLVEALNTAKECGTDLEIESI